jgi:O-antigen/teichoic acid export membrane protein
MLVYAIVPFLNIVFTLGLETSYFRFSQDTDKQLLFNTLNSFLIITTAVMTAILVLFKTTFITAFDLTTNQQYYVWMVLIIAVDTLSTISFAKLRHNNQPKRFAVIKFLNILINVLFVLFWLVICPWLLKKGIAVPTWLYNPEVGILYFVIANLVASVGTFIMLLPIWQGFTFSINKPLLRKIMSYSFPIIIVGFGGMINEFLSRITYYKILDDSREVLEKEFGIFSANYKLAVLVTLFIQVFKMGAEPFFFKQSGSKDAPETYARVTKIFTLICCILFLFISCNLQLFQKLIASGHKEYAEGIHIVPILTLANIFLGLYYNLSIWYKITNNTYKGAIITFLGVLFTVLFNIALVPSMHYTGSAWATFICYFSMLIISYFWGQKYYPVPYDVKNILLYFGIVVGLYLCSVFIANAFGITHIIYGICSFIISSSVFMAVALRIDKKEFASLPFIKKYIKA